MAQRKLLENSFDAERRLAHRPLTRKTLSGNIENSFDAERRLALRHSGQEIPQPSIENSFDAERRLALTDECIKNGIQRLKIPLMPKGV